MIDASIAARLSALRADIASGRPREAAREAVDRAKATAAEDIAGVEGWVKVHPLAAVGLCLLAGAIAGGAWKWGRGR